MQVGNVGVSQGSWHIAVSCGGSSGNSFEMPVLGDLGSIVLFYTVNLCLLLPSELCSAGGQSPTAGERPSHCGHPAPPWQVSIPVKHYIQ